MSSFKDNTGREWKLRLTVGVVTDVKRETGVDLGKVTQADTAWITFLFGDPGRLVAVLWVLCEKQATAVGVTPEDFGHLFDGTTLEAAGEAFAGAIADFFPRSRIAKAIRESLGKILAATDEKAVAELTAMTSTYCNSASRSQESAGSIPPG